MDKPQAYSELLTYFRNERFVLDTQRQISIDFAKFNLFFPESFENTAFSKHEIELEISQLISRFLSQGETRLLQLIYTIDLPEKDFLALTTHPNFVMELSKKILYREAMKVFLRMKFSNK